MLLSKLLVVSTASPAHRLGIISAVGPGAPVLPGWHLMIVDQLTAYC